MWTSRRLPDSHELPVHMILAKLRELKLEENTLIFLVSDNGGELCASNGELSGGKHSNQEGGIRVPMIVRWPKKVPAPAHYRAGTVDDRLLGRRGRGWVGGPVDHGATPRCQPGTLATSAS